MSNTKTIAKNTGWYGLENAISSVLTLVTSIAIARTLGPTKMGYIIYVAWIASVVSGLGGLGIPATTRKYMAEFLGMGDRGTARYIYFRTLLFQLGLATLATAGLLCWVFRDAASGVQASLSAGGAQHLACNGQQHFRAGQRCNGGTVDESARIGHFDVRFLHCDFSHSGLPLGSGRGWRIDAPHAALSIFWCGSSRQ